MSSWLPGNRTVFCVFLGHIQKGFSPFSHHELSSGDRDLLPFLKNERGLICLHLHLLQGQPSGSDVLFPFTQQHVQMQFKKWSKRNFQEPVFCLKMRYDSCYSETFFTFYAQVITLKLLPEHLCLGQSTTILWMPFMWEYHCKAMNSLLEIGAQDFHFKRKKLFQFPQGPNARGRKGLGSRTRTGGRGRVGVGSPHTSPRLALGLVRKCTGKASLRLEKLLHKWLRLTRGRSVSGGGLEAGLPGFQAPPSAA